VDLSSILGTFLKSFPLYFGQPVILIVKFLEKLTSYPSQKLVSLPLNKEAL
jgi:hypothetical protein